MDDAQARRLAVQWLMADYRRILVRLKELDVIRTKDSPTGGYAEYLVAAAYGGTQAESAAQEGWDVTLPGNDQVQVKSYVRGTCSKHLAPITSLDYPLIILEFAEDDYRVLNACRIEAADLQQLLTEPAKGRGWRPPTDRLMCMGRSVLDEIQVAEGRSPD